MAFTPPMTRLFRAWDPLNYDEEPGKFEYGTFDVASAAMYHVRCRYARDEFDRRSWPLSIRVRDLETQELFDVSVDCDFEPRFTAAKPEKIKEGR